jgi:DNA-binding response OmpR family regulator
MNCLVREDYRVFEADSAAEALEVSQTFPGTIDLLIADHTLKTMTGRQVAEQIRQSRPGLKVLHISGLSLEILEQDGGLMPGAEFLAKPFSPKALVKKVDQMLGCRPQKENLPLSGLLHQAIFMM